MLSPVFVEARREGRIRVSGRYSGAPAELLRVGVGRRARLVIGAGSICRDMSSHIASYSIS